MCRHISEAARALNKLAFDYKVISPVYLTPLQLKLEDERKICTPQTSFLVSSFQETKEEVNPYLYHHSKDKIEPNVDSESIAIGTSFESLEEAANVFEQYAINCGFNTCKGNSKKDVYQEFACSARGKVRMRKVSDQSKQRNRKSIKKMCKCHIILRKKDDLWVITTRKLHHTHSLLTNEEIKKTAKNRFIPEEYQKKALELYHSGLAPAKIQYKFETELQEKCTWSMKDLYNMLYKYKESI